MIKVTVKDKYLNVRVGRPSVNADCYQYIAPGSEIEVDGELYKGDMFDGIDTWLKDGAGNYYWSGGVNNDDAGSKTHFDWFDQLKIQQVWDQFHEKGSKVKVAVLDTGCNFANPDIGGKITTTKIFLTAEKYPGIDLIINDQSNDLHGTHTSSLIGAMNSLNWLVGIAPDCELILGKISINKEIRDFNYIIEGIKWAISQGAEVISVSYAHEGLKDEEIAAFNQTVNGLVNGKNVLIFAASGNSGVPQQTADLHPASFDACVSVGASTDSGQVSSITVLSTKTIIHAPGENIESYDRENSPKAASGTSFSTPIVAGICALAVSFLKKKNAGQWDKADVLRKLYASADPIPGAGQKKVVNPVRFFSQL